MKTRIFLLLCILILCICPVINVNTTNETASTTCEDVIQEIVSALDNRDWNSYLEHLEESKMIYMRDHYFATLNEDSIGINQIVGAELKNLWALNFEDFDQFISYNEYDIYEKVGNQNIFGYLLGIDYDVTVENRYFHQGLNYNLWIFAFDGNNYKLVEFTIPEIDLIEKYISSTNIPFKTVTEY